MPGILLSALAFCHPLQNILSIKKLKLISLFLLISISTAIGQRDFRDGLILTLQGDTIFGQVDYRSNTRNYTSCLFRNNEATIEYFPDQIAGFGYLDDKFFSSQIVLNSFVEVLVLGDLSLYKFNEAYFLEKGEELFELESKTNEININGKLGKIEDNKWKGIFSWLISDCLPNTNSLVSTLEFQEKSITKLVIRYNKCKEAVFIVFKKSKPWTQINFGASVGTSGSNIHIKDKASEFSYLKDSYYSIDPLFGLMLALSSPRITDRLAFQGELYFSNPAYSGLVVITDATPEYHDSFIDLQILSVPLSLKFFLPEKKYGLYFQGGINYDFHLDSNTKVFSESISGNVVNTFPETQAFEINNIQLGVWGGLGLYKSFDRFTGSLSLRYFQMPNLNQTEGLTANVNRISLNLILFTK